MSHLGFGQTRDAIRLFDTLEREFAPRKKILQLTPTEIPVRGRIGTIPVRNATRSGVGNEVRHRAGLESVRRRHPRRSAPRRSRRPRVLARLGRTGVFARQSDPAPGLGRHADDDPVARPQARQNPDRRRRSRRSGNHSRFPRGGRVVPAVRGLGRRRPHCDFAQTQRNLLAARAPRAPIDVLPGCRQYCRDPRRRSRDRTGFERRGTRRTRRRGRTPPHPHGRFRRGRIALHHGSGCVTSGMPSRAKSPKVCRRSGRSSRTSCKST